MVTTEDICRYFARGLVSDLHPLREISMVALVKLLDAHTQALRPSALSAASGAAGQEREELFVGWAPDPVSGVVEAKSRGVSLDLFVGQSQTHPLSDSALKVCVLLFFFSFFFCRHLLCALL